MNDRAETGPPDEAPSAAGSRSAETFAPPSGSRHWISWLAGVLAWGITLVMLALAGLRLLMYDATNTLTCLNAFTFYIYLPAYVLVGWALWRRRWPLAACNALIVLFHLTLIGPDFLPAAHRASDGTAPAGSATVRLFYANVRSSNTEYDAMLEEIAETDPDVVVLNEFSRQWLAAFTRSPVMQDYLRAEAPMQNRIGSIGIFSKLPITLAGTNWTKYRLTCEFDVLVDGRFLRLFVLHGPRPVDRPFHEYRAFWQETVPIVAEQPSPLVVIGDFNMTQYAEVYQRLIATRLRSAHADVGRGYATTWPNGRFWLPPIRIDHALLSPEVECLRIVEGRGKGSDHRPLVIDFRLRPAD